MVIIETSTGNNVAFTGLKYFLNMGFYKMLDCSLAPLFPLIHFHRLPLQDVYASANSQVHTLRRMVREKDQTIRRQSRLERQAQEAQQAGGPGAPQPQRGEGDGGVADSASPSPPPCPNLSPR